MAADQRIIGSLRVVTRNDAVFPDIEGDFAQSPAAAMDVNRDHVLDYLAEISTELEGLAASQNCVFLAHLFKMASIEANDLRQRAGGRQG